MDDITELGIRKRIAAASAAGDTNAEYYARVELEDGLKKNAAPSLPVEAMKAFNEGALGLPDTLVGNPIAGLLNSASQIGGGPGMQIERNPITRFAQQFGIANPSRATPAHELVGDITRPMGASVLPMAGLTAAARTVQPVANAGMSAMRGLGDQILRGVANNPGSALVADQASAASSGLASNLMGSITDSPAAKGAAGMVGGSIPAIGSGLVRSAMRGGESGRQLVNSTLGQFGDLPVDVGMATGGLRGSANKRAQQTMRNLPGGGGPMQSHYDEAGQAVQSRLSEAAKRISTSTSEDVVGRRATEGIERFVQKQLSVRPSFRTTIDGGDFSARPTTSSEAWELLRAKISARVRGSVSIANTRAALNDMVPREGSIAEDFGTPIIRSVARKAETADVLSMDELHDLRKHVGRRLADSTLISDVPKTELKRLYAAITRDMEVVAKEADAGALFSRANKWTKALHSRVEDVLDPLVRQRTPEKVARAIARADASELFRLRRSLPKSTWDSVVAKGIEDIARAKPGAQNFEGDAFDIETFLTNFVKMKPRVRGALFGRNPGLQEELTRLAAYASRVRETRQSLFNSSGTAPATLSGVGMGAAALAAVQGELGMLGSIAAAMGTVNGAARLMTHKPFVRWLGQMTQVPAERAVTMIARMPALMGDAAPSVQDMAEQLAEALESMRLKPKPRGG